MRRHSLIMFVLGCAGFLLAGCDGEGPDPRVPEFIKSDPAIKAAREKSAKPAGPPAIRIAIIPKTIKPPFWRAVRLGVINATREDKGIRTTWEGPANGGGAQTQAAMVASFVNKKIGGIILAPVDGQEIMPSLEAARKAGIPVLALDSEPADLEICIGRVGTDHAEIGRLGAEHLAQILGHGGGKVILVRGVARDPASEAREKAFLEAIAKRSGIQVVSSDEYAGQTSDLAASTARTLLSRFRAGQVNGIFCSTEAGTTGMLRELNASTRAGAIRFVGVDYNDELVAGLLSEAVDALVVQNTIDLGAEAVKVMVAHIRGQTAPKRTDVPPILLTLDRMTSDRVLYTLTHPPKE